jgi:MHS family proline/betaine transporter-like MFS transporter
MDEQSLEAPALPAPIPVAAGEKPASAATTRTVVAGAIGNVLEWYDFGLFGFFAPVISRQFFPAENRLASLLGTFGVFAVGFLVRPLGGILFGSLGDRLGRKRALEVSVLLMAIPTTLLGLLPTHAQIGIAAPVLLTVIRILQGLSVGGEYIGSMSFLVEHARPGRRAFVGSWSASSTVLGTLLGSGVAALLSGLLSDSQMSSWGWRLPFLGGMVIGLLGLWLRSGVGETPVFLEQQKAGALAQRPISEAVSNDFGGIAITLGFTVMMAVGFYLPFVWLPTWLAHINQPPLTEHHALTANTVALVALLLLTPVMALIADRVGYRRMILAAATCYALLSYPLFLLMSGGTFTSALLAGTVFGVCCSLYAGCMSVAMADLFPTRTRYSGVAIGYNGGQALFGGTAPLAATALINLTGDDLSPAFYLIGCAVVGAVAGVFIKDRHGEPLR